MQKHYDFTEIVTNFRHSMSGSGFDIRSRRVSIPKEFCVATPEEYVKKFGGNRVINKVLGNDIY